jgi:hypothetical protein
MKRISAFLSAPLASVLLFSGSFGCGKSDEGVPATAPLPPAPELSFSADPAMPDDGAPPDPGTPQMAREGTSVIDDAGLEDASELERLNFALATYFEDVNRPAIDSFEPLVKLRILKSVPVAPPGMKYVIDMQSVTVRLEKQ